MKERAPAFQFYPRQFAADDAVTAMDLDAVGAHTLLMCYAAASPERYRIHAEEHAIRNRLRNPSEVDWQRIKSQLLQGPWKVSADGQWWEQDGLRRTFEKQKTFSEQQRQRANARWESSDTGIVPDACRKDAERLPTTMPDGCSSSSSSNKNILSEVFTSDAAQKPSKGKKQPSDVGIRLAGHLKALILRNNPEAKITDLQPLEWAREADRMIQLDSRSEEQITALMNFSQRHDFWKKNICSMGALRKQFDRLTLERSENTADNASSTHSLPTPASVIRKQVLEQERASRKSEEVLA